MNFLFGFYKSKSGIKFLKKHRRKLEFHLLSMASGDDVKPLRKLSEAFKDLTSSSINPENQQQSPLEIAPFCCACYLVSPLFQCLGIAFRFGVIEYVAKVDDILEASKSFSTLEAMLDRDFEENCMREKDSHTMNLLRVKRSLDLIKVLFENILASEDYTMQKPLSKAYEQVFSPYHGWAIRKAVAVAIYATPSKAQLLEKIAEDEVSARAEMQSFIETSGLVISYLDNLFLSREFGISITRS